MISELESFLVSTKKKKKNRSINRPIKSSDLERGEEEK